MSAASWPTFSVQVAFNSTTPGAFILDTSQLNTGFLGGLNWQNILTDVRGWTINGGRQTSLDRFQASQLVLQLDNTSGNYDPDNTAGAYFGTVNPGVPIRITAIYNGTGWPLFYGYVDEWLPQYTPGSHSYQSVQVTATDAMDILSNFVSTPQTPQGAGETTDARINRVLDNMGWDASLRNLDVGLVTLQDTDLSQAAFDDIQTAVDSELGLWYISRDGLVRFERRTARLTSPRSTTAQWTWSDRGTWGTDPVYETVIRRHRNDLVRNLIQGQCVGGTLIQREDLVSQAQTQGPRSLNNTSLLLEDDAAVASWCDLLLYYYKDPLSRIESVTFDPLGDPSVLWPICLGAQISDRATVVVHPPVGSTVTKACFVEGVSHSYSTGDGATASWSTTFPVSPADKWTESWFILDDPSFGVLDSSVLL